MEQKEKNLALPHPEKNFRTPLPWKKKFVLKEIARALLENIMFLPYGSSLTFLISNSRLELVPQLKKDGTPQTRTPSKFALFVKQNYARIKSDNDRFSHQDVMKALSSEFAKVSTT